MRQHIPWVIGALAVLAPLAMPARADQEADQLKALITKVGPSIVTVRAVVKSEYKGGGESESNDARITLQACAVTADGLVMVSNTPFSPKRLMEMMGGDSAEGMQVKMTPTSIKVTIPGDEKEYDAFLAATDTTLDLAFIKIENLGDKKLTPVDFGASADAAVGQKVAMVSRFSKGYDYAPFFHTAVVCGEVTKPRKAWVIDGNISQFGLPIYAVSGEMIGVLTTVPGGVKDDGAADAMGFAMIMRMMGGGGSSAGGVFIVPGSAVKGIVEQASQKAVEVAAERAKNKDKAPAPTAPAGAKPKPAKPAK